jgi:hypothetical protein
MVRKVVKKDIRNKHDSIFFKGTFQYSKDTVSYSWSRILFGVFEHELFL